MAKLFIFFFPKNLIESSAALFHITLGASRGLWGRFCPHKVSGCTASQAPAYRGKDLFAGVARCTAKMVIAAVRHRAFGRN